MTRQIRVAFLLAAMGLAISAPASAGIIFGFEDPNLFGDLDQHDVNCPATACGPTAATNSFVFLQNMYPALYNGRLVPGSGPGGAVTYQDQVDVANLLGTEPYMGSCGCVDQHGTYIEDFIIGKQDYINDVAPGTTTFEAQIAIQWLLDRSPNDQPNTHAPKPDYVEDETAPTAQFIAEQIERGQDVEVFLGFTGGAHYLTLTGIFFDTTTDTGFIDYIDPDDGDFHFSDITGFDTIDGKDYIELDYNNKSADIFAAVAESPVPEPGALMLAGIGLGFVVLMRRRKAVRVN